MADELGLSFSPTAQAQQQQAQTGALTPIQQAIRILSLHVPRTARPSSIAPNALLTAPGAAGLAGAGSPGGLDFVTLLRRLLAGGAPPGAGVQPSGPSTLDPNTGAPISGAAIPHVTPATGPVGIEPVAPPVLQPSGPVIDRRNPVPGNRGGGEPTVRPYGGGMSRLG
jgi:hypothetical protein